MNIKITDLKESLDFLNIVFDNITSAIFIVDKDVRIQNFNDSFKALFKKSESKILGNLCGNAIGCVYQTEENKDCGNTSYCNRCILRKSVLNTFLEKVPTYKSKLERNFYIDDIKITKHFIYTTKYVTYNNEEMVLIIVDDVTELEEKNQSLKQLNNEKNDFIGMAAHDLRGPISIILMYANYILDHMNHNLDEDQIEFLNTISHTSNYMVKLIHDFLNVAQIESGKLQLNFIKQDYPKFVKQIVKRNQILASNKKINISLDIANDIDGFFFDANKIEQVLNNLISNAIKYSHRNTNITITVFKEDDYAVTRVIDEGQGIPEKELSNIFVPFNKSSVRPTEDETSTGLGLSIVKHIVEKHEGNIFVESEVGKGSSFTFRIPIKLTHEPSIF